MDPTLVEYRRVSLGIRAPRPAVLVSSESDWSVCLSLVETLSGIWGGDTFGIIPTDGETIPSIFWKLLKIHDPDWFLVFARNVAVSDSLTDLLFRSHAVATPL